MTKNNDKEKEKKKPRLSSDGKRAAHVKWDGKTIALGTFPDAEAEVACKRAKSLTRSWRAMFPKPTVEEVKRSLEKIGIRQVNDRPGRQPRDKDKDRDKSGAGGQFSDSISAATSNEGSGNTGGTATKSQIETSPTFNYNNLPSTTSSDHMVQPDIIKAAQQQRQESLNKRKSDHQDGKSDSDSDEDGDLDETYETLERHHSNLADEILEIRALMEFYGEKRERKRMRRKRLEMGKNRTAMKRRRGVGPEPLDPSMAGGLGGGLNNTGMSGMINGSGVLTGGVNRTGGLESGLNHTQTEGLRGGVGGMSGTGESSCNSTGNNGMMNNDSISIDESSVSTLTTNNVRNLEFPTLSTNLEQNMKHDMDPTPYQMKTQMKKRQRMDIPIAMPSMNMGFTADNVTQGNMPPPLPTPNNKYPVDNLPEDWR